MVIVNRLSAEPEFEPRTCGFQVQIS